MFKNENLVILPPDAESEDFLSNVLPPDVNEYNFDYILTGNVDPNDITLDVADFKGHVFQFVPTFPRGPPERKDTSGSCDFKVEIDGSHTQRKKFLYSHKLNRIFVEMLCNFSVSFNWDVTKVPHRDMFIRATVVFSDPGQQQKRVERCLQHSHSSSNAETSDKAVIYNVLRSARELGDPNVYYCGNPDESDSWYSVLVRMNAPTGHAYKFVCKNSCSSGINRRHTDIIYTLEDSTGAVYGRQSVGARACSCPRRDFNQQEEELLKAGGKRPVARSRPAPSAPSTPPPPNKRIKVEVDDSGEDAVIDLTNVTIIGGRATVMGMKVAYCMMESNLLKKMALQQPVEELKAAMAELKNFINKLETKYKI